MKLLSWNVNGLRACATKGFEESVTALGADIICIQETKMQPDQYALSLDGYKAYFNSAEKKGYSGTALITRVEPSDVRFGMGMPEHDNEGRIITAEFDGFTLVNCYTPNSQRELTRLRYRLEWERDFRQYVTALDAVKPVIICGDLNVAHNDIDLKHPKSNRGNAGFTDEERSAFTELLGAGFVDSFRRFYPDREGIYSWWSYQRNARATNSGWRIDYFIVSRRLEQDMVSADIYDSVPGSDHCPVGLEIRR